MFHILNKWGVGWGAGYLSLKCLHQARNVSGHVCECQLYRLCFYDFSIRIWNCSDSVVIFVFYFMIMMMIFIQQTPQK